MTSNSSSQVWKYLAVACLLVISFPGYFHAINVGLDPSWIYAINYLTQTDYVSGRDFVHTFGPLGYLLQPLDIGSNLTEAVAFRLVIHGVFAACLLLCAYRAKTVWPVLAFVVGYAISMVAVITLEYSYQLLVVESLVFCVSIVETRLWRVSAILCGALAASMLFMKFGIGIAAAAILASAMTVWILGSRLGTWRVLVAAGGSYLAVMAVLSAHYLGSAQVFAAWFARSLNMADGFTVAQSIEGSRRFLLLALLSLAVYAWLVIALFRQNSPLRYVALVFAVAMFLAFKHGFVRVYGHERNFFPFLLAAISVVALNMTTAREAWTVIPAYLLVLGFAMPIGAYYSATLDLPPSYRTLIGQEGFENIASTVHLAETRRKLALESARNLASRPLPGGWKDVVDAHHGTVDVLPWELSYVFANNFAWKPNVTLQLFNSYTPLFDRWNADHFLQGNAPDFLIVEFLAIDGRHLLLDTPAVTRSILRNYAPDKVETARNLALLARRPQPLDEDPAALGGGTVRPGEWIDVPRTDRLLFGSLDMSLSPVGIVTKALFRIPPVYLDVVYASERQASYRITPEVAKEGLLLNYLPATAPEFFELLKGCAGDRVTKFRITGPGAGYYRQSVDLRWEQTFLPSRLSRQWAVCAT
jgi:hypothetical protein